MRKIGITTAPTLIPSLLLAFKIVLAVVAQHLRLEMLWHTLRLQSLR
jgi:hypothetical protein